MKPGTLNFIRRSRMFPFGILFILASFGSAQQAAPGAAPVENPPAAVPAAQPLPQSTETAPNAAANPAKTADTKDDNGQWATVKLGAGDLVDVSVYNVPDLSTKARVSNAGDLYLPLIDYVHVDGLTQEEAQALIEKRYEDGGFLRNPHVTIFVDDAASQGVTVLGEVLKPGIYPDVADHKLYELISEAGGFTPAASRKIAILRQDQKEPIRVELPRNLGDDPASNVVINPGDTITVPRAPVIYVVGDVGHPSGFLVDNGTLSVLQALALAGGVNHTAKLAGARIIRKGPGGMTEVKVEVKKMLQAKSPDVTLQADDILFIPVSGARVAAGKSFDAAMSMATMVGVYSVHP
ncbi:MAG TPA: polysaccharide biosynthesis/export family protein [Candidatus Sulfotelmatobacter sp.]|nr:polysaccharide biosynthesis/export family protein [Candidatus Sulfotelmatobacter sp.]